MLFRKEFLEGIRAGIITLAFRRWQRPSVRAGGTLLTPIGQISIKLVESVSLSQISAVDARQAGYGSRAALLEELQRRSTGDIYRIELGSIGPDPRIMLRETRVASKAEHQNLQGRLRGLDERAIGGAWTFRTLEMLASNPGVRARDLCGLIGQDKERFKINVRKLKNLGLTESLGTGYRLSPRGRALLNTLRLSDACNAT